jgi:replicative DNA helicase
MSAHSNQAEQSVLGACMIDDKAFWEVADLLTSADFWDARHRSLWDAMVSLAGRQKPFDVITISDYLREADQDAVGYVLNLANNTPSSVNVRAYAEIVAEKAQERRVCDAGARISKLTGKTTLLEAQEILGTVSDRVSGKTKNVKEAMSELVKLMHTQTERDSDILGVPYGFPQLDDMTAGMHAGDLVLVAGRPSMGKSLLAMQIGANAARSGCAAHIVTLEMPTSQCMQRLMSAESSVPFDHVRDAKKLEEWEWPAIARAGKEIGELPLYFDDDVYDLQKILARIRQVHSAHGTRVVVIDYLTFIRMPKADTQALAVQEVTRELKALAKALGITIILVSQLNRGLETRGDKRPMLSDLRESGAIEQDADVVLMIYRDEYHDPNSPHKGFAEVLIRKQRNGPTGMVPLATKFECQRFDPAPDGLPAIAVKQETRGFGGYKKRGGSHE